jgi:flavin reductase (DIM6/NTAB) family NADH-FMN oxidoreductase RutF
MKKITIDEALHKTSPQPVSLICVQTPAGTTNLAIVAWWTYLESEPPMLGFSMGKESYTCELLAGTGKAVLSIPGETIADAAFECGCVSGRDVNKAEKFSIGLVEAPVKYPVHSRLAFICTVENKVEVGDCIFFICSIDDIYYNENERQIFAWGGSKKLSPVVEHCGDI